MGLLDKLFGNRIRSQSKELENAIIIHFQYGKESLTALHGLESRLESVLAGKGIGEYDGHEIATDYSDGILYLYGPNAEILFKGVKPTLESTDFIKGALVKLRFGPPEDGVQEIEVKIGSEP